MDGNILRKPPSLDSDIRINERGERRKRLEQLSGFNRLTRRQQDIILGLSYIQDLAGRGRREAGFARASKLQESWWCHKTIQSLELEQPIDLRIDEKKNNPPQSFYDAEAKYETNSVDAHILRVKEFGYPCVVLLREAWKTEPRPAGVPRFLGYDVNVREGTQSFAIHTLLVLGEDTDGDIIGFHKDGEAPFEEIRLQNVIASYDFKCFEHRRDLFIGIRRVHCLPCPEHLGGIIEPIMRS